MSIFTATSFWNIQPVAIAAASSSFQIRTDAYSASLKLAMPYSIYSELGMTAYTSSIDGLIRTGNINNSYMLRLTSSAASYSFASASVVSSGSSYDWAAEGYTSSLSIYNAAQAGVILTSSFWIDNQSLVVETWFRKTENFTNPPFHKQMFGNNSGDFILFSYTTGNVFRFFVNGVNTWTTTPNATLVNNTWYHIAYVKSGTNAYVYLNGNRIGVGTRAAYVTRYTGSVYYDTIGTTSNNDGLGGNFQDYRAYLGTDKGYTGTTITVPLSIVDKVTT